jgi:hypothetical protein
MLMLAAPYTWAQDSEVKKWQDSLTREAQKWGFGGSDDANNQMATALHEKYGFKVSCDRGMYGLMGSVTAESCSTGLVRIEAALKNLQVKMDPDYQRIISIEIGKPGYWRGIHALSRDLQIPYNASPQHMTAFLNTELSVAYDKSVAQLMALNRGIAARIKANYFAKVTAETSLDVYQVHDGIKKLEAALNLAYDNRRPSPAEFAKFGFDTVVIASSSNAIYQDHGELRIRVNYADHEGKMFMDIIKAVAKPDDRRGYVHVSMRGPDYDWNEVVHFRDDRARVGDFMATLKSGPLKNISVRCQLDAAVTRAIDMAKCRKGLETLNSVASAYNEVKDIRAIEIAAVMLGSSDMIEDSKTLVLDPEASPEKMAGALHE